jgi:hypothetical protein
MEYGGQNINNIENINNMNYMKSGGNVPTNPELWSRAKAAARSKYDVYPSAYANGFASKWYKQRGGGWRKAEYGMEVMGNGGVPNNPGFNALPEYVQQNIINNMATGGQKMPPELAYARFAAAGNLDQLDNYGYQNGGNVPMYGSEGEPDGEMALGQIDAAINKLTNLRKFIQPNSNLEPWVSSKLTMVDDYANSVSDYMMYNPENNEMMELPMEEMEYGGIPMYGPGGQTKPTASDSLAVMNSQIALNKFYDNEVKKGKIKKNNFEFSVDKNLIKNKLKYLNDKNLDFYRSQIRIREENKEKGLSRTGLSDNDYKKSFNLNPSDVSKLEYQGLGKTKSSDAYRQYYRDLITPLQNLAAPFALVDSRIKPRAEISYSPIDVDYPGGAVSVYDYDPIAIKPAAMKTAADWAYMQKTYGTKPPAKNSKPPAQKTNTAKPPVRQTVNTTMGQVTGNVRPNQIKGSQLVMMMDPVRSKENLERLEMVAPTLVNPKIVTRGELLPVPSKQTVNLTNLIQPRTYPIDIYDRRGNFIRQEFMGDSEGVVDQNYIGEHHYAPRGGNSYIDTNYAEGGGIPERYRNMGFTNVGVKKQSTRPGKKWMVLAKKGDDYKVVHGGYKGMQDFKQHHSEQRKENFWSRMGGRNSSKATDPFSPLYWHKRFGTWEYGGQPMVIGGQNMMNSIVKKDNRNWLEYLKN